MNRLKQKHGLKHLRFSMSYKKFSNLREIFQGDLNAKVMANVESKDFKDTECNCRARMDGGCYSGPVSECRSCCIIYKATCKVCNKCYIGNTQQEEKKRMGQHFGDVKRLVNKGTKSDSFAAHMAVHFQERNTRASVGMARAMVKMEILWKGNIISCMKSFGKRNCKLCMKERMEILNQSENYPNLMINSRSEIFGGCRHKPKFHRYHFKPIGQASTDDGVNPERVEYGYNGKYPNLWTNNIPANGILVCPLVSVRGSRTEFWQSVTGAFAIFFHIRDSVNFCHDSKVDRNKHFLSKLFCLIDPLFVRES